MTVAMKALALFGVLAALAFTAIGLAGGARARQPRIVPVSGQEWYRLGLFETGARFISPTRLALVTSGSPECPVVPYAMSVQSPHSIRIDLTTGSWKRRPHGVSPGVPSLRPPQARGPRCSLGHILEPVAIAIDPKQINVHRRLKVSLYYFTGDAAFVRPVVLTAPPL